MKNPFVLFLVLQNRTSRYILPLTGEDTDSDSEIVINEIPRQSHLTVKDVEEATDEESNWAETESTPGRRPVRMGSLQENCGGEVSQEGNDKVVQGNLEEATTEVSDGPLRIEETVSTGEESLCLISSRSRYNFH